MTTTSNNWFFNLKNCEHFNCLLHFCLFSPSIHWLLVFFYIKLGITQRLLSRVAFNSRVYIYRTRYRAHWPLASALYSMSPMYIRLHKFVYELMTAHHYLLLTWCFLTQEKAPTPEAPSTISCSSTSISKCLTCQYISQVQWLFTISTAFLVGQPKHSLSPLQESTDIWLHSFPLAIGSLF